MQIENKTLKDKQIFNYNKEFFCLIKTIAILLMLTHHLYGFSVWHVSQTTVEPRLVSFALLGNICVGMFAFITGWTYAVHKEKTFRYSAKKILGFLSQYWIMLFFVTLLAVVFCGYSVDLSYITGEIFLKDRTLIMFAWYVIFYIEIMLILPLISKLTENKSAIFSLIIMVLIYAFFVALYLLEFIPVILLQSISSFLPVVFCGYWLSRFNIMKNVNDFFCKIIRDKYIIKFIVGCVLIVTSFMIYKKFPCYKFISTCLISCPMLIFGVYLLEIHNLKCVSKPTKFLSKHIVNIWFFHSIFFSDITNKVFQPILYVINNPVVTIAWCLIMGVGVSILLNLVYKYTWPKLEKSWFK